MVATEYYRPRDRDFGQYVRDLKAVLLGGHPDSAAYIDERGDTLDIEAVQAAVDCLYLPGFAEQLRLLLPQLKFYSIETFYLGSDGWGDDAVYRLGDDVTRLAVFPSPFLEQERSQEYVRFASEYDARYGEQPHRLAGLGYDAVKLIAQAVKAGAATRQDLVAYLSRIKNYAGAVAPVTFGEHRENVDLPMYQLVARRADASGRSGRFLHRRRPLAGPRRVLFYSASISYIAPGQTMPVPCRSGVSDG